MRTDEEILKNQNFHSDGISKMYLNGREVMVTWSRYESAHCEVVSAFPGSRARYQ